ncbi:MAG TPA: helix-turn-helix domain-containing protein, partial [Phycisphaerae bacterium]|nr:helix-turn-helix domain-containing protein [Phycisphaerae bacterium]
MNENSSNKRERYVIPAVEKAVELLEYLGRDDKGYTQAELVKELNMPLSTCYRIIQTLQKRDWIRKIKDGQYTLSGGMLSAAMNLVNRVARFEAVGPNLKRLADRTELTCKLSIRQGNQQVTILRAESPRPMSVSGKVGSRFPVIEGSVGAALLCDTPADEISDIVAACGDDIIEAR